MSAPSPADVALTCATLTAPLAVLALSALHRFRRRVPLLWPLSVLPALILSAAGGNFVWEVPGVIGMRLGLDAPARTMLLFTAIAWAALGLHARRDSALAAGRERFSAFALAAIFGNIGAILAQHVEGFHLFFAIMIYSTYGLVVHGGTPRARRAAAIYLAASVLADTLLVFGLLVGSAAAESEHLDSVATALSLAPSAAAFVLLLAAFGARFGLIGLHAGLMPAARAAPVAAAAALFGPIAAAGVFGWLRLLPLGDAGARPWAWTLVALGLAGIGLGLAGAAGARRARTALAYAGIAQGGYAMIAFGRAKPVTTAMAAILHFAVIHLSTMIALFLLADAVSAYRNPRPWSARALVAGALLAFALEGLWLAPLVGAGFAGAAGLAAALLVLRVQHLLESARASAAESRASRLVSLIALALALASSISELAMDRAVAAFVAGAVLAGFVAWWSGAMRRPSLPRLDTTRMLVRSAHATTAAWRRVLRVQSDAYRAVNARLAAATRRTRAIAWEPYEAEMRRLPFAGLLFILLLLAAFLWVAAA